KQSGYNILRAVGLLRTITIYEAQRNGGARVSATHVGSGSGIG
nr:hypothetical protein [Tanacetum cinerariifolium]